MFAKFSVFKKFWEGHLKKTLKKKNVLSNTVLKMQLSVHQFSYPHIGGDKMLIREDLM